MRYGVRMMFCNICHIALCLTNLHVQGQDIIKDSILRFDYFSGDSVPSLKSIFRYNDQNQVIQEDEQRWSLPRQQWEDQSRTTRDYQGDLEDTTTRWAFNQLRWIPESRIIGVFENKEWRIRINQTWDDDGDIWVNETRTERNHNLPNRISIRNDVWNRGANDWRVHDSTIALFMINGEILSDTTYLSIPLFNIYLPTAHTSYKYDSSNNLTEKIRFEFSTDSAAFQPRSRDTMAYD
ncbi:MAG: DUF3836 domain-containing protein, partial [Saprospiraceae bacterium]|nr:DUF3836 domain-containing protein [Saprospiraceae bacterium]